MEKISVLIPTFNASSYIDALLKAIYSQELHGEYKLEVIIIDSSSRDNTVKIVEKEYPSVTIKTIKNNLFNHGGTRNQLASLATGKYLLFMTQDAIPFNRQLISSLLKPFKDEKVVVSYAKQVPKKDASLLDVFARNFNYPEKSIIKDKCSINSLGIKTFFNSNVCSMYRKDIFESLGKFPENIILNEDMIFASKVILNDYKISYTSEAQVYHSHNYSLMQQFKRYFDIGMAFDQTSYLLKYASNEKEGLKMVVQLINYLLTNKKIFLLPYALAETAIKLVSYQLGKKHRFIPLSFKKKFSAYMK